MALNPAALLYWEILLAAVVSLYSITASASAATFLRILNYFLVSIFTY